MRSLGIELNREKIKLLELEETGKRPRILQYLHTPLQVEGDRPWGEQVIPVLKGLIQNLQRKPDRIVISLDSSEAIVRELRLPFTHPDQIRKVIKFEVEQYIHNYAIDELIVDYYISSTQEKKAAVLTVCVPKQILSERLRVLQECDMDPIFVDLDTSAVFNVLYLTGQIQTEESLVVLYGDDRVIKFIYVNRGKFCHTRSLRFQGLGDQGNFTLAKELDRFLFSIAAVPPGSLILLGFEPKLTEMIQQQVKIPVKSVSILEQIEHRIDLSRKGEGEIVVPLGLALKGLERDALGFDFRKEEFVYRRKFEMISKPLLIMVQLLIFLLVIIFVYLFVRQSSLSSTYQELSQRKAELFQQITARPPETDEVVPEARAILKEKIEKMGGGTYPVQTSGIVILRELFNSIFKFRQKLESDPNLKGYYLAIKAIEIITAQRIVLSGQITSYTHAEILQNTLKENRLLAGARLTRTTKDPRTEYINFAIQILTPKEEQR